MVQVTTKHEGVVSFKISEGDMGRTSWTPSRLMSEIHGSKATRSFTGNSCRFLAALALRKVWVVD